MKELEKAIKILTSLKTRRVSDSLQPLVGFCAELEEFIEETRSYETDFETSEDHAVAVNLNIAMDALAEIVSRNKPNVTGEADKTERTHK